MAIYGIDLEDEDSIDAARLCRLAFRLPAYQSAIASRVSQEQEQTKSRNGRKESAQPAKPLTQEVGISGVPLFEID